MRHYMSYVEQLGFLCARNLITASAMIFSPPPPSDEPPFIVEITNHAEKHAKFHPTARVLLGTGLQSLARSVGLTVLGTLVVIASSVTANGVIAPSARTLSRALGRLFLRRRLARLTRHTWRGKPLLSIVTSEGGRTTYRLSQKLVERRELSPALTAAPQGAARSFREAIIAQSRSTYANTKEVAEREINAQMGWASADERAETRSKHPTQPKDVTSRWAVQRLVREGVDYSLAVKLVKDYGAEAVIQQVKWLDSRKAKNRARFVVGAIMQGYPAPDALEGRPRVAPPSPDP